MPKYTQNETTWITKTTARAELNPDFPWNVSWPKGVRKTLHYPEVPLFELFHESVVRNQDYPYLNILGINYSFNEVNEKANQIANALVGLGTGLGSRVGIFMPNIPQFVFAFYGILKTGATIVPISPLYGSEELKTVIQDSGIHVIFALDLVVPKLEEIRETTPMLQKYIVTSLGDLISPIKRWLAMKVLKKLPKSPEIHLPIIKLYEFFKSYPKDFQSPPLNPKEAIAVIGYTGGTTGIPKGAMLTHYNLVANLYQGREWARIAHPIGVHKKFIGAVPFFHIIGLNAVMLVSMFYDSTVYLFPDPRKYDSILKAIQKYKINYFHGVPTLHKAVLSSPTFAKYNLSSLEMIFSGAASLDPNLGAELEAKTGAMVIEAYGMTETSPMVAANPFEKANRRFGTIGIPFPDTEIRIIELDSHSEIELGHIGEIAIKGPQVMAGYLNHPEETTHSFWNGFLLTGDMAYMDRDGFLYIVNRKKDMINASGYKIYPSELESLILKNFPEVEEAIITGTPDEYRGESVKLLAILKEGAEISKEKIIEFYQKHVAVYKIPQFIEFVKSLPKTSIGKIDRKAIRDREYANVKSNPSKPTKA